MCDRRQRLVHDAVPTLFDVPNPPAQVTPKRPAIVRQELPPKKAKVQQTVQDTSTPDSTPETPTTSTTPEPDTPRKMKLKRKIMQLRSKLWRMQNKKKPTTDLRSNINALLNTLRQYLPEQMVSFIHTQLRVSGKSGAQIRWASKDKMFALSIYYHSKKAYKVLARLFKLPSISTLKRTLQRSNIQPGFNDKLFNAMKTKVDGMQESDRQCVLIFDEMSLKSGLVYNSGTDKIEGFEDFGVLGQSKFIANHATVFMVRGLRSKWKQPLGYVLTSGPVPANMLKDLVFECVRKATNIGLNIRLVVCDQGSNNRSFLEKKMGVTRIKPYFYIDGAKIYATYDAPHLIKSVRNNLVKHGFKYKNHDIKWEYIVKFYEFDQTSNIRMADKLTDRHINLRPFAAMRVNLATQVLSHSVAVGVNYMVKDGKLEENAKHTAQFLDFFDQLFNTFNSSNVKSKQPFSYAFSQNSTHWQFLQTAIEYLDNLSLSNNRKVPCIEGWKQAIVVLKMLWHDLSNENEFKFLLTNRLNQDCIENLFSIVRGKGGFRDNPTPEQFRAAFRQIVVDLMLVKSELSNCQSDIDKILLDITSITPKVAPSSVSHSAHTDMRNVSISDYIDLPTSDVEQNVAAYIGGYLLRKMQLSCERCLSDYILTARPINNAMYSFLNLKAYTEQCGLVYPTPQFVHFVENLENLYLTVFPSIMHMPGIMCRLQTNARELLEEFIECTNEGCIQKINYGLNLYLKVRVHATLRRTNNDFGKAGDKRNKKIIKLMHL